MMYFALSLVTLGICALLGLGFWETKNAGFIGYGIFWLMVFWVLVLVIRGVTEYQVRELSLKELVVKQKIGQEGSAGEE